MKRISEWLDKCRLAAGRRGYTCDCCGREVFFYPRERLCGDCLALLPPNDKRACPKCGRETAAEGVCLDCKRELPAFSLGVSPFVYCAGTCLLLNRLKNGERYLSGFFGEKMAEAWLALKHDGEIPLVAPVPMTKEKMRSRGYNQAAELAKVVADRIGAELGEGVLVKVRETLPQKELAGEERKKNVSRAYRIGDGAACKGRAVLLVDDLMTTGATGSECARVLLNGGAKEVFFLTAASLSEKK